MPAHDLDRRDFLKLGGAVISAAPTAGLTDCASASAPWTWAANCGCR
jgi:hypothetical protein